MKKMIVIFLCFASLCCAQESGERLLFQVLKHVENRNFEAAQLTLEKIDKNNSYQLKQEDCQEILKALEIDVWKAAKMLVESGKWTLIVSGVAAQGTNVFNLLQGKNNDRNEISKAVYNNLNYATIFGGLAVVTVLGVQLTYAWFKSDGFRKEIEMRMKKAENDSKSHTHSQFYKN